MRAWLRVQTHRLTVKECCFHYHLLLYDHDREHTARITYVRIISKGQAVRDSQLGLIYC